MVLASFPLPRKRFKVPATEFGSGHSLTLGENAFILGGNATTDGIVFGRLAGKEAPRLSCIGTSLLSAFSACSAVNHHREQVESVGSLAEEMSLG